MIDLESPQIDVQVPAGLYDRGNGCYFGSHLRTADVQPVLAARRQRTHRSFAPVSVVASCPAKPLCNLLGSRSTPESVQASRQPFARRGGAMAALSAVLSDTSNSCRWRNGGRCALLLVHHGASRDNRPRPSGNANETAGARSGVQGGSRGSAAAVSLAHVVAQAASGR